MHTHTHTHEYTHTHAHTRTHTLAHMHAHTHTHTYAYAQDAILAAAAVSYAKTTLNVSGAGEGGWGGHKTKGGYGRGGVNFERAHYVLQRLWAVGARPKNGARQLLLAAARESMPEGATSVPASQARQGKISQKSACY